ncbi:hypothetical protein PR048_010751 [Dryococelus australis]|uniref:Uncharacterized protein n=1 Tax=Dryococelus australis TaxID=614101 RepID=A0ABQ9I3K7_9NEOP|nr:hypothetical protein PR048_010751 [Dryococelus australis]
MWSIIFQSVVIAMCLLTEYLGYLNRITCSHLLKRHQTNIGIKNTHNGLPTTVTVTKSTELLHEAYKNVPALPEEHHKLLKFVTLSEHARMFYQNALSDIVEGDQVNNIVVHVEEEPFV